MKAVILTAGIGSRLQPLTNTIPKALIMVNNKPILEHQIETFIENEIRDIIVVTGYKREKIKKFLMKFKKFANIKIVENRDYKNTNNMYSFYLTRKFITKDETILVNGDVIFDSQILKDMIKSAHENVVGVDIGRYNEESMKVVGNNKYITDISKKIPHCKAIGNSIDLYKFSKEGTNIFLEEIERSIGKDKKKWVEVAIQRLVKDNILLIYPLDIKNKKWIEIDDLNDLCDAEVTFNASLRRILSKKVFFLDLDGTFYLDNILFPKALDFLKWIVKNKGKFFFLSNNSSESTDDYMKKLKQIGISLQEGQIILSTHLVINYLRKVGVEKIFIVGTHSLKDEFRKAGFEITGNNANAVVIGFDKTLTYAKLKKACFLISKEAKFIATHGDKVCPTREGFIPDAGAITALVKTATGKEPIVFGKPRKEMLIDKLLEIKEKPDNALLIGDRLYTDIKMGENAGVDTVLVLTGETSCEEAIYLNKKPTWIFWSIEELFNILIRLTPQVC